MQTYLLAGSFVVAGAAAPFAAHAASQAAYAQALAVQRAQQAALHQVRAVLTETAQSTVNVNVVTPEVPATATWTSVTGVKRTGMVIAPTGSPRGTAVMVWTDTEGDLTIPPLSQSQVAGQGDLAAIGAITGVALLYLCQAVIVRNVLYRRRIAAWEADWVVTAQEWNRQSW